jgi:hypothetical protein
MASMVDGILQPFCAKPDDPGRYRLDMPFTKSGWRYATNGCIAVRVPDPGSTDTPEADRPFPNGAVIFQGFDWALCTEPLPGPSGGTVNQREECVCERCGDIHECFTRVPAPQKVGGLWFSGVYLELMRKLPGVCVALVADKAKPMAFVADGGLQGLISRTPMEPA